MARVLLLVLALVLWAAGARADDEGARRHFRRGVELYDKKSYADALEEFRAAYREKPSAGIKQNIALCLKGLGRLDEAATSFDEALDEGQGTLKEGTRTAMERELAELVKQLGTLNLKVVAASDQKPIDNARVTVDGAPVGSYRRPIRVKPGIHVIGAHVDGMPDPPEKKLSFVAGQPVDATFEIGIASGTLTVRVMVPEAVIRVDHEEVGHGQWTGKVTGGSHHLEVAADGWATTSVDVVVAPGTTVDFPIEMRRPTRAPDTYVAPPAPPEPPFKRFYIAGSVAIDGENLRLSAVEGEAPEGKRRDFAGGSASARFAFRFTRFFAVDAHLEAGTMSAKYRIRTTDPLDTSTQVVHWAAMPMLRFTSPGKIRFTLGAGVGAHGTSVNADVYDPATQSIQSRKGGGVSLGWLLDAGAQLDLGPVFLEPLVFFELHGLAAVRDDATDERMLQAAPGARAGIRIGLGFPF